MEYDQNSILQDLKKKNNNENEFINDNNLINYNLNANSSKITIKNPQIEKNKSILCNLNDPRLIKAYNEGYYGINNIPQQYYIYPSFCNYNQSKRYNEKKIINENVIDTKIFRDLKERTNNNGYCFIKQFPFLEQIKNSSNKFGKFHSINVYNNLDKIFENKKEKNESEKSENSINISMKLSDDRKLKIKGYGRIVNNKNIVDNNEIIEDNVEEIEKYGENFYCINNNIMQRNTNNTNKFYENNNIYANSEIN